MSRTTVVGEDWSAEKIFESQEKDHEFSWRYVASMSQELKAEDSKWKAENVTHFKRLAPYKGDNNDM